MAIGELEPTRAAGNRRLYVLADVGIVCLKGVGVTGRERRGERAQQGDRPPRGCGGGRRPVKVTVDNPGALDPGVLPFAAFVVRGLAEDDSADAGAAASDA